MRYVQNSKAKMAALGTWLTEDPRRLTTIFTLVTALAAVLALTTGLAQPGTLVGPNPTGGSGGG